MANFKLFLPKLIIEEGGYIDNPDDQGGPTNFGITLNTLTAYLKKYNTAVTASIQGLQNLTRQDAEAIYKKMYWDECGGDHLQNQSVAEIFIDWYINSGNIAIESTQEQLRIKSDGIVGCQTINTINHFDADLVFFLVQKARIKFIEKYVEDNPGQKEFLTGWLNRINSFIFAK